MLELNALAEGDLLAQLQLLVVLVVLLLVLLQAGYLRQLLVQQLQLLLDFDEGGLAHLLLAALFLYELLEPQVGLFLLLGELSLPLVRAAVLLDLDPEEALLEAVRAILTQLVHLRNDLDALVRHAVRVQHPLVGEVGLREAPQLPHLLLPGKAHSVLHGLQRVVVALLPQLRLVDLFLVGDKDDVANP